MLYYSIEIPEQETLKVTENRAFHSLEYFVKDRDVKAWFYSPCDKNLAVVIYKDSSKTLIKRDVNYSNMWLFVWPE
jgi:hypothetical protein